MRVYKLVDVKPTGPYVVTLARVAASQAMMLSKSLHLRKAGVVGTIKPDFVAEGFPPAMATSNFGVLIPTDIQPESFSLMRKAFYYHQYLFDRTINSGTKKYSLKEDIVSTLTSKSAQRCTPASSGSPIARMWEYWWPPGWGRG